MDTHQVCPTCGTPVAMGASQGLCPQCLMKSGFETRSGNEPGKTPFVPPSVGEMARLFPQLEIIELLGQGGMGAVYKSRQPRLDRFVALKIIAPERQNDPQFAERFEREARALASLVHPNIVMIYDFGDVHGNYYLLMEFVDGLTLRQLYQTRKLAPAEALGIVAKICEALQYAHEQGIVHRDIKPENILIDKKGQVKIADFGVAKILDPEAGDLTLTGAKDVVGTVHYMAPEQIEKPQTVDCRADIYSLGVVFYEMLTGELPLGKFPLPSQKVRIDVRLDQVVLHALEKEPELRYQKASEVKTDVETIATTSATTPPPVSHVPPVSAAPLPPRKSGGWKIAAMIGGTILVLFLILSGAIAFFVVSVKSTFIQTTTGISPATAASLQKGGAVALWEAEGDSRDSIGNNDGELRGDVRFAPGQIGRAFDLNGTNADILVPANAGLNVGTANGFTLLAWIKPTDVGQPQSLFEWNEGGGLTHWGAHFGIDPISFDTGPGALYANLVDDRHQSHKIHSPGGTLVAGKFQLVALTYDKTTGVARIYCNDSLVADQTLGSFTPLTTYDLCIARRSPTRGIIPGFAGLLDEPAVFNRALSAKEIQTVYAAGLQGKPLPLLPDKE